MNMRVQIRKMPPSVRRHNLARLRQELNLTQRELAELIGRSHLTIRAIETGSLVLSNRLATMIAGATGVDKGWLMHNVLDSPMPPLARASAKLAPSDQAYGYLLELLDHLFDRLIRVLERLKDTKARRNVEDWVRGSLDDIKGKSDPTAELPPLRLALVNVHVFEFFKAHPEFLDPDLAGLIDLDFLIKDALRLKARTEEGERFMTDGLKAFDGLMADLPAGDEQRKKWEELKQRYPDLLQTYSGRLRGRSPASPSRGGRRKKRATTSKKIAARK